MHDPQETEPDYRFTFANERTFLAWVRTALAILAGAMVIDQLASHQSKGAVATLTCTLGLLAALLSIGAYWQWKQYQRAMRLNRPLPASKLVPLLGIAFRRSGHRRSCRTDPHMTQQDAGLQKERTEFAWSRTGALAAVNAALMPRSAVALKSAALFASTVLLVVLALFLCLGGFLRARQFAVSHGVAPAVGPFRWIAGFSVAAACCATLALH